ncbi:MAG: hypothetical protein AW07_01513 [Candidatus Accumulibacter sp. SK-11]|nr:MAG: hypothetical protein AW07_01513 [Candidatus Accumulibacter sp. SK-11]
MQDFRIDQVRQAVDDGLGQQILARQVFECRTRNLRSAGLRCQHRSLERQRQQELLQRLVVLDVALDLAVLDFVERRLGDVDVSPLDQLRHLPVEEGQQQGADVRSVDVRIGHDDQAVIAQLLGFVLVLADSRTQRGDQGDDLLRRDELVETRLLDIEDLSLEWQDRLELAVATLFRRSTGRITLDQVEFAERRILFLAVGQLSGQTDPIKKALASGHLPRLARSITGTRRLDDLAGDHLCVERPLLQKLRQLRRHHLLDRRARLRRNQLHLRLRGELRIRHLDRQHTGEPFAHVVAADVDLRLLGYLVLFDVAVDDPRHGSAQAGHVGPAIGLRDVVGETQDLFGVAVVPLHRHFDTDHSGAGN